MPRGPLEGDGGGGCGAGVVDVAPEAGTLVVFRSEAIPHEARPTLAERQALVGWFRRSTAAEECPP